MGHFTKIEAVENRLELRRCKKVDVANRKNKIKLLEKTGRKRRTFAFAFALKLHKNIINLTENVRTLFFIRLFLTTI